MFKKVDTDLNFVDREKRIEEFWKKEEIFEKSINERDKKNSYVFFDGPPTANGKPHIGHVETRAFKDLIPRYHAMKGSFVPRKAGWDTHGLPVELEVEKSLGINGKDQIEEYGIEPFIDQCKKNVWKYKSMWEDFSFKVGFWADMDNPYVTYYDDYIESEWWALKEIYDKSLLYKSFKIVPYCPRCGTPLSSHEVAQGYKDVVDTTAIVKFKVKNENAYFLAWTTTPWTLPSNMALCLNADFEYVKVKCVDGYTYYLAKELCDKIFDKLKEEYNTNETYEILESFKGSELEYKEYEPLFDYSVNSVKKQNKKANIITCDSYVTLGEGTGIVHMAPAFGEDDARVCKKYDIAFVQFVDEKGCLTKETDYEGLYVKKANEKIIVDLEKKGKIFSLIKMKHSYPHCWRCNTPLIYYARESWFIKMTQVKEDLIKNNNTINWYPDNIGKGRFGDWIQNVQDWGISRNRYWGTPLPIWEDEDGNKQIIGSRKELKELYEEYYNDLGKKNNEEHIDIDKIELHRPFIDKVNIKSKVSNKKMTRVKEVIDCWFDSGAMPFAQHHYPFENKELFEKEFPAQFICEAVDQTRGWFYSLLAESTLLFNKSCFENVLVLGHVTDENGQKMSKTKGNAVDPMEALNKYGSDAIRWFFYINSAPWLPKRFSDKNVQEGQNKFLATLQNVYAFFVLYANIDEFNPKIHIGNTSKLTIMDEWLISKLNNLIKEVDDDLSNYRITESANKLLKFVDDLSNWYVRRNRDRFWAKGMEDDKKIAYSILYYTLIQFAKLIAPFTPFIAEEIYNNLVLSCYKEDEILSFYNGQKMTVKKSIHLLEYPLSNNSLINKELEQVMDEAILICELGRSCRNEANIKNRQPLQKMLIKANVNLSTFYIDIIKNELNIKEIIQKEDLSEYTSYIFKPQLKTLGPKYGKLINNIKEALNKLDTSISYNELKKNGFINLKIDSENTIKLEENDIIIDSSKKEGFITSVDGTTTVVLDTNLDDNLIEEGFIREIVSKIQTMRKEASFEVMDLINVYIYNNTKIEQLIEKYKDTILREIMSKEVFTTNPKKDIYTKEWDINKESVTISIEVIK
ncbi:MAG: isoleucine--tRNA ligase [Eubacteriales bacterium]|nr:isoleucine--tRNA ligase [Eubacteriales bacterium]